MTTGEKLKTSLNLDKFQVVKICRVIGIPINLYIIYYNSKYKNYPINRAIIDKANNYFDINKSLNVFTSKKLINTPLIDIEDFNTTINNAYIIKIDLIGLLLQNKQDFVEDYIIDNDRLREALYFKDLSKSAGMSNFTKKFAIERKKIMGSENRLAKLIDCKIDKVDNSVTFYFLTPSTEKYPPNYIFQVVDPVTKLLKPNPSKLYTIEIKILNFFDWLDTTPVGYTITRKDLDELLNIAPIQIWSDSPSFHYQGMNYNNSLIDGSIYPTDIQPKHWDKYHGEYAFTDKHLTGILLHQDFYMQQMAAMLTKRLKSLGYLTKNINKNK